MTNEEYKQLILLKKHFFEEKIELPIAGEKASNPILVLSDSTRDTFLIDTDRKKEFSNLYLRAQILYYLGRYKENFEQ